eukprot:TRINITY_DN63924_c0_g1_i1.p1 TRINITY_DN63924_c0_g1~~TRINITY_DN63924_c0_g1_i1.p1  ORF type:complete len:369 (-),score=102.84 TRINITY_DN63924_c0_g1_i1:41-1105(-)
MEKVDVDMASLEPAELERLAKAFAIPELDGTPKKLCGGYSSVNYAVQTLDGRKALLRVIAGGAPRVAENNAAVLRTLADVGIACPTPLAAESGEWSLACVLSSGDAARAVCHRWVEGVTANKLLPNEEDAMLRHLGSILATLHNAPQPTGLQLLTADSDAYVAGFMHAPEGSTWDQCVREVLDAAGDASHPLTVFLAPRQSAVHEALAGEGLPRGLLHGDPFLDNLMVGPAGATMIDWDEVCVGPFMYDLASAVVGGCFDEAGVLRAPRLRALLQAYQVVRPLSAAEAGALPQLLCANAAMVAWYRWRAFHIEVKDAPETAKESYKEMIRICCALETGGAARETFDSILSSVLS